VHEGNGGSRNTEETSRYLVQAEHSSKVGEGHKFDFVAAEHPEHLHTTHKATVKPQTELLVPKIVIFSQFIPFLNRVLVELKHAGISYAGYFRGTRKEKDKDLQRFRVAPGVRVLLLHKEGSHGLDLSFVSHIILMDSILDEALEKQVVSRAYRMGARKAVSVEQIITRGTVEEHVHGLIMNRRRQSCQQQNREMSATAVFDLDTHLHFDNEWQIDPFYQLTPLELPDALAPSAHPTAMRDAALTMNLWQRKNFGATLANPHFTGRRTLSGHRIFERNCVNSSHGDKSFFFTGAVVGRESTSTRAKKRKRDSMNGTVEDDTNLERHLINHLRRV
jgi:hypothetical protein